MQIRCKAIGIAGTEMVKQGLHAVLHTPFHWQRAEGVQFDKSDFDYKHDM